jgi:hypothetical protein
VVKTTWNTSKKAVFSRNISELTVYCIFIQSTDIDPEGTVSATTTIVENPAESAYSDAEQLGAEITELCSYIYAAESRLLTLIREFDEKEYWARQGLCSCAHWLNFKCGIGMNAAREKVRVAHALAKLPKINKRFAEGALSYSKVRAITRIADEFNEDYLLMLARHGTAHHVEKSVSKYRTAKRLQDAEFANEQYNNREVTHYYDHDGCLVIKARLPAEQGALIVKALEMAMDENFAERSSDVTAETSEDNDEPVPIAARRADALANIAETYMNNNESSGSTADRYQVVVHVHCLRQLDRRHQGGRKRRNALDRTTITVDSTPNAPRITCKRQGLSLSRLHQHAFRRWTPHKALG